MMTIRTGIDEDGDGDQDQAGSNFENGMMGAEGAVGMIGKQARIAGIE